MLGLKWWWCSAGCHVACLGQFCGAPALNVNSSSCHVALQTACSLLCLLALSSFVNVTPSKVEKWNSVILSAVMRSSPGRALSAAFIYWFGTYGAEGPEH